MVFVRDEGRVYDAPLAGVWDSFGAGMEHSDAHRHRDVQREQSAANSGRYAKGLRFFLYYEPLGPKARGAAVGSFTSSTIPEDQIAAAVNTFFSTEFEQDPRAIRKRMKWG